MLSRAQGKTLENLLASLLASDHDNSLGVKVCMVDLVLIHVT
jgi:hypothetical protein